MEICTLIDMYLKQCKMQNNLNNKTIKAYSLDLEQFVRFLNLEKKFDEKEVVLEYIYYLNSCNYATKTVKRKIASLKAFFAYLNYEEKIVNNPFLKIKLKVKEPLILPQIIPLERVTLLLEYAHEQRTKYSETSYKYKEKIRDILLLELLIGTGIRVSELCTLKVSNINIQNNSIKINGKGSKERVIPIYNKNILDSIKLYSEVYSEELLKSEFFFVNKRKNRLSTQSVRYMIKKYCNNLNINEKVTPHMFRHTFATMLLDEDVDSRHIQMILGHSSITTTQIYTHITSNKKMEIMKYKNPRDKIMFNKG